MNHFFNSHRNLQNFPLDTMGNSNILKKNNQNTNNQNINNRKKVFQIFIQLDLKETIDLPEIKKWNINPKILQGRMYVSVRRYGFFFTHKLVEGPMRCILTHGNFLIVYTKERLLKGHAVKLSSAQKINIYCNSTEKNYCTIHIEWNFGEISLTMTTKQAINWRSKILEAFEGVSPLPDQRNISVQTENQAIDQKQNQERDLSLKKNNPICNKNQAPFIPMLPPNLFDKKFPSTDLLCEKHQSMPKINLKQPSVGNIVEINKTGRTSNTPQQSEQKNLASNTPQQSERKNSTFNTTESLENKKNNNDSLNKTEEDLIDYTPTSSTASNYKSVLRPKNVLRRSLSSSALDLNKTKYESDNLTDEFKSIMHKRALGQIERSFTKFPNNYASWFTIVGRYGFTNDNTVFSCFKESPAIVTILNPENVQKVRELFKKKIDDEIKMQGKNSLSWTLSNDPYLLKSTNNSIINNDFLWQRRFFESDA